MGVIKRVKPLFFDWLFMVVFEYFRAGMWYFSFVVIIVFSFLVRMGVFIDGL